MKVTNELQAIIDKCLPKEDVDEIIDLLKHERTRLLKDARGVVDDKLKELNKAFDMMNVKEVIREMFKYHLGDIKQGIKELEKE